MKKVLVAALCVAIGLLSASIAGAFSTNFVPGIGINGTVHDIAPQAGYAAADPQARICIYCHAPHNTIKLSVNNGGTALGTNHNAPDQYEYLPLWNHELTYATYMMYYNGPGEPVQGAHRSQAMDLQSMTGATAPGGLSLLCLSCHDGTVAINSYGTGPQGNDNTIQPTGSFNGGGAAIIDAYAIGKSGVLQNHHPVGFDYEAVRNGTNGLTSGDNEIRDPLAYNFTTTSTIADHLYNGSGLLSGCTQNCMECGTCHSVHNKGNTGERLLWRSDQASRLCLTCHDKGAYTPPGAYDFTTPNNAAVADPKIALP